jgi:Co/Zn/Cd efflux system component
VEIAVAWRIESVALFADAVDFLEDTAVNLLVLFALSRGARLRAGVAMGLAAIICVPGLAVLWTALGKFTAPTVPEPTALTLTGAGALLVNVACALILTRVRSAGGSLMRAAYLSARNDAAANVAVIGAGLATAATLSVWPDLLVGIGIALLCFEAARDVLKAARAEWREGGARPVP